MKEYLILGDNGFWYSKVKNLKQIEEKVKDIKRNIQVYGCGDSDEKRQPSTLYVYEVKQIDEIEIRK